MPPLRRVRLAHLVLLLAAYSLAHLANNTLLAGGAPATRLAALQAASGGLLEPVLLRSWLVLGTFLVTAFVLARLSPCELGWNARALGRGLATFALAWGALQLVLLAWTLARGATPSLHPMWTRFGVGAVLGGVLAQALGHALCEDTAFRAFFLPQLRARLPGVPLVASALALLGAALLFGLAHLPTRILVKSPGGAALLAEQAHFLSAGLALGLAWLASGNLGFVVALHVVLNDPAPLVACDGTLLNRAVLLVLATLVLVAAVRRTRAARAEAEPPALERAA